MSAGTILLQVAAAFFGTLGFALLFGTPKQFYFICGLNAALGWLLYCLLTNAGLTATETTFFCTIFVILLSRFAAVRKACPVTVFLTTGIFPLIPGGGIYWTAYYLVMNEKAAALESGFGALKAVIAIVLGIIIVLDFPAGLFTIGMKKKEGKA